MRSKAWVWAAWSWAKVSGEGPPTHPQPSQRRTADGSQPLLSSKQGGQTCAACAMQGICTPLRSGGAPPASLVWPHGDEKRLG